MIKDYTISPAEEADLASIVAIYNSTIAGQQSTAELTPTTVAAKQEWFQQHGENRPLLVLKNKEGEVFAWASLSDYHPREAYKITAEISLYVHENARQQGLGKILLEHMLTLAPECQIKNVVAIIFGHNHASIKLFKSLNFIEWGRLPNVCQLSRNQADVVILGKNV